MSAPQLPCTVLRLAKVYGSGGRQHYPASYLKYMDDRCEPPSAAGALS